MKIKKVIGKIVSVMMVVMAVCSAVPVFGASVGIAWSGNASTPGATIETASNKLNGTPVRVWYDEGNSSQVGCTVWAKNEVGEYVDVTYYGTTYHPYYAPKKAGYAAISNTAYGTYGNCEVKAYMVTTYAGSHSGRWLPAIY